MQLDLAGRDLAHTIGEHCCNRRGDWSNDAAPTAIHCYGRTGHG
jgi:hypothetical protein